MGAPKSKSQGLSSQKPRVMGAPGRPRNPKVEEAVIEAARELLVRGGYDNLSFEAIAQMTGVTRPTIYRRWPSKAHLACEIANGKDTALIDVIEEQGLRAQIRALAEQTFRHYESPEASAAVVGVITACHRDPKLRHDLIAHRELRVRSQMAEIVGKGKALNLIKQDTKSDLLIDVLVGTIMTRLAFGTNPAPSTLIDDVTDLILRGIENKTGE